MGRVTPVVDQSRLTANAVRDENGCLNWSRAVFKAGMGYGMIQVDGDTWGAHRVAYATLIGPIPEGMVVRHKCDNPRCINPEHLELGTPKENSGDMISRGRSTKGVRRPGTGPKGNVNANAHLTESRVLEIRARCEGGYSETATPSLLAREFGVTPSTICKIVKRQIWTHI